MSARYPTLDSLAALGFDWCHNEIEMNSLGCIDPLLPSSFVERHNKLRMGAIGYRFESLHLLTSASVSRYGHPVVRLTGVVNTGRTMGLVEQQIPPNLERPVEAAAWVSYALRDYRSELGLLPAWFLEGENNWDLIPPARAEKEMLERMEQRRRAFENCPKCFIDREYARLLRQQLRAALSRIDGQAEMMVSFGGRILSMALHEAVCEVVASGDCWTCAYRVAVDGETTLPKRYLSPTVCLTVLDGFLSIDGCRLGSYEAVE